MNFTNYAPTTFVQNMRYLYEFKLNFGRTEQTNGPKPVKIVQLECEQVYLAAGLAQGHF